MMPCYRALLVVVVTCFGLSISAQTQPGTAEEQLDRMRAISTPQQAGAPSFHIAASFQTFDYKGQPDGEGTVDELFRSDGHWKRTVQYRGKQDVLVQTDKLRRFTDKDFLPAFRESTILNALFTPIPEKSARKDVAYRVDTLAISGINMHCIVTYLSNDGLQNSKQHAPNIAYCTDPETGVLRLLQGHNFRNISFNRLARLGAVYFARDIAIMEGGVFRAKLQVTTLEPAAGLTDADLQPPASLPAYVDVSDQADFSAAHPIKQPPLSYSADATRRRVQGCVILNLYISREGNVRDAEVVSAPDDALVLPAMDNVWGWRFSPFTVGGKPVDGNYRLFMNFNYFSGDKNTCSPR